MAVRTQYVLCLLDVLDEGVPVGTGERDFLVAVEGHLESVVLAELDELGRVCGGLGIDPLVLAHAAGDGAVGIIQLAVVAPDFVAGHSHLLDVAGDDDRAVELRLDVVAAAHLDRGAWVGDPAQRSDAERHGHRISGAGEQVLDVVVSGRAREFLVLHAERLHKRRVHVVLLDGARALPSMRVQLLDDVAYDGLDGMAGDRLPRVAPENPVDACAAGRPDVPQRGDRPVVEELPEPSRYLSEELVERAVPEVALHGVEGVVDRIGGLLLHVLAHHEHHAAVHGRAAVLRIAQVEGGVYGPVPAPELLRPVVLREEVPLHGVAPDEPARGVLLDPLLLLGDERVDERVPGPEERRVVRVLPRPPSEKVGEVRVDRKLAFAEHVADVVRVGTREAVGAHLLRDLSGKAFLVDVAVGGARREDLEVHARHFALAAARREVAFDVLAAVSQDRGLVGDQLPIARRRRLAKRDAVGYLGDDKRLEAAQGKCRAFARVGLLRREVELGQTARQLVFQGVSFARNQTLIDLRECAVVERVERAGEQLGEHRARVGRPVSGGGLALGHVCEHVERAGERRHVHLAVRAGEETERRIDLLRTRRTLGRALEVVDHLVEVEGLPADHDRQAAGVLDVHGIAVRVRRSSAIAADVVHVLVYEFAHLLSGQRFDCAGA